MVARGSLFGCLFVLIFPLKAHLTPDKLEQNMTHFTFVERWRTDWGPGLLNQIAFRVFLEPAAFIMERKMLLGIKQRAENQPPL